MVRVSLGRNRRSQVTGCVTKRMATLPLYSMHTAFACLYGVGTAVKRIRTYCWRLAMSGNLSVALALWVQQWYWDCGRTWCGLRRNTSCASVHCTRTDSACIIEFLFWILVSFHISYFLVTIVLKQTVGKFNLFINCIPPFPLVQLAFNPYRESSCDDCWCHPVTTLHFHLAHLELHAPSPSLYGI